LSPFEQSQIISAHSKIKQSRYGERPPCPTGDNGTWTVEVLDKLKIDEDGTFSLKHFVEVMELCPETFKIKNVASKWRARLAPTASNPLEALVCCHNRMPFFNNAYEAKEEVLKVTGERGVDYCLNSGAFEFARPKLGMVGGWGRPNSDVINADGLALIDSVKEVLSSAPEMPLNLQMFHRPPIGQSVVDPKSNIEEQSHPSKTPLMKGMAKRRGGKGGKGAAAGKASGHKSPIASKGKQAINHKRRNTKSGVQIEMSQNAHASRTTDQEEFPILSEKLRWPCHEIFDFDFRNSMGGPNRSEADTKSDARENIGLTSAMSAGTAIAARDEIGDLFGGQESSPRDVVETTCQRIRREELAGLRAGPEHTSGVVCDNATRFSRRGAITWWHLDDCGEFVSQIALPCPLTDALDYDHNGRTQSFLDANHPDTRRMPSSPIMIGPGGNPIMKMFFYLPRESYDLVTQDFETGESFTFHSLDPFNTFDDELPDNLPIINMALLEAGGQVLTSPPNIPHIVYTTQTCVMTEQRRISKLFLDECDYFHERASNWNAAPPHFYPFNTESLHDDIFVQQHIVLPLVSMLLEPYTFLSPVEAANTPFNKMSWPGHPECPLNSEGKSGTNCYTEALSTRDQSDYIALLRLRAYNSLKSLISSPAGEFCSLPKASKFLIEKALGRCPPGLDCYKISNNTLSHLDTITEFVREANTLIVNIDGGVHAIGYGKDKVYAAFLHIACQPKWGPSRKTQDLAMKDARVIAAKTRNLGSPETDEDLKYAEAELLKVVKELHDKADAEAAAAAL